MKIIQQASAPSYKDEHRPENQREEAAEEQARHLVQTSFQAPIANEGDLRVTPQVPES